MEKENKQIDDTYFRRFFVPLVISILIIAGIFVIIAATPGTPAVLENELNNMFGGGLRRLVGGGGRPFFPRLY